MMEELEALLKEQFQKCNIQFCILPHISNGAAQPLILHAEYDHFSLSTPPPNSWPKWLSPIFYIGLFFPQRVLPSSQCFNSPF